MSFKLQYKESVKLIYIIAPLFLIWIFCSENSFISMLNFGAASSVIRIILVSVSVYDLILSIKSKVTVTDTYIKLYSKESLFYRKVHFDSINSISVKSNSEVRDRRFADDAVIVDIKAYGPSLRLAISEEDHVSFCSVYEISDKIMHGALDDGK